MTRMGVFILFVSVIVIVLIDCTGAQYGGYQPQQARYQPQPPLQQQPLINQGYGANVYQPQRQAQLQPGQPGFVPQQQRYQQTNVLGSPQNGMGQNGQQNQMFPGQSNVNINANGQVQNSGGQPGLLSNPVRDTTNRLAVNSTTGSPTNFYLKIENYQNSRWVLGDGTTCNPASSCSFAFTSVIASLDGSVVYNSTNFFSVSGSTGQLMQGDWTDAQMYGLHTKPISVDIFVHSLTFNNGYTNGSKYIFNTPVSHVDTFVLNLVNISPTSSAAPASPQPTNLVGQKMNTALSISYYIQCAVGFMGDYCDLQCSNYTGNSAICTSTVTGEHKLCTYDSTRAQVGNCTYCEYRVGNNSCANLFITTATGDVSSAFRTWTIVLAVLLALAVLLLILVICLKFISDRRNRQAQQFPQNRQPSAYSGGYRPNAGSGATPLQGGSERDWERERQPAIIRRPPQATIPEETSTQNESFQETRPFLPPSHQQQQQRREAQV